MNDVDGRAKESVGEGVTPQWVAYEVVNQPFSSEGEVTVIVLYGLVELKAHVRLSMSVRPKRLLDRISIYSITRIVPNRKT